MYEWDIPSASLIMNQSRKVLHNKMEGYYFFVWLFQVYFFLTLNFFLTFQEHFYRWMPSQASCLIPFQYHSFGFDWKKSFTSIFHFKNLKYFPLKRVSHFLEKIYSEGKDQGYKVFKLDVIYFSKLLPFVCWEICGRVLSCYIYI